MKGIKWVVKPADVEKWKDEQRLKEFRDGCGDDVIDGYSGDRCDGGISLPAERHGRAMTFRRYPALWESYAEAYKVWNKYFTEDKLLCSLTEEMKNMEEDTERCMVDVGDELRDLLQVYSDADVRLRQKEGSALRVLTSYMKCYIEAQEERREMEVKLELLKHKMGCGESETEEEEEDE